MFPLVEEEMGKYGLWTTFIGAILILIDGIAAATIGSIYGFYAYGGAVTTGWVEIILSLIMFSLLYYYSRSPAAVGWTEVILALITLPFDGGFWTIGAWIALIGGILIAYRK